MVEEKHCSRLVKKDGEIQTQAAEDLASITRALMLHPQQRVLEPHIIARAPVIGTFYVI